MKVELDDNAGMALLILCMGLAFAIITWTQNKKCPEPAAHIKTEITKVTP